MALSLLIMRQSREEGIRGGEGHLTAAHSLEACPVPSAHARKPRKQTSSRAVRWLMRLVPGQQAR